MAHQIAFRSASGPQGGVLRNVRIRGSRPIEHDRSKGLGCSAVRRGCSLAVRCTLILAIEACSLAVLNRSSFRSTDDGIQTEVREWARFFGSRACPKCLTASAGAWQLRWKLGWAAVCPTHRMLLVDHCPRCRIQLRRGPAGQPRRLSRSRMPAPMRCGATPSARTSSPSTTASTSSRTFARPPACAPAP
ncbi:TniQ family protein [Nonomuraea sp. H19]|uniref:TniQ family protein n=1 Tax=Nonomuraea sp. H19 TaxID=3452206 RepID=UPI003F8B31BD